MVSSKFKMAMVAMKEMGISTGEAKNVLNNLLELYDHKWEYIEADGYSVLVEAIFDSRDSKKQDGIGAAKIDEEDRRKEPERNVVPDPICTRSRLRKDNQPSSHVLHPNTVVSETSKRPRVEQPVSPQTCLRERKIVPQTDSETRCFKKPKTEPTDPLPNLPIALQEPKTDGLAQINGRLHGSDHVLDCSGSSHVSRQKAQVNHYNALCEPKQEQIYDFPELDFQTPIAVIHPLSCSKEDNTHLRTERGPSKSIRNDSSHSTEVLKPHASQYPDLSKEEHSVPDATGRDDKSLELVRIPEAPPSAGEVNYEIASTSAGEVKLSLSCNSMHGWTDLQVPSIDEVLKLVEDRCLKSYKFLQPSFSVMKLMKEFCQCFLELSTDYTNKQEKHINVASDIDLLRCNIRDVLGANAVRVQGINMSASASAPTSNDHHDFHCYSDEIVPQIPKLLALNGQDSLIQRINSKAGRHCNNEKAKKKKILDSPVSFDGVRPVHDVNDISKGEEKVRISLVNEASSEPYPPSFYYIPNNIVYQSAYVNFSLARIGDEDCCSECFGDCLSSSVPCACARETGGEFAYTLDGLVKNEFLDEAISMNRDPQNHKLFYCKDCPLERSKNESGPEPCKGHLVRKFIKECWSKCGCNKQCGNRVVQRGVTCNLQVFLTSEGKGWGLRTLEELPRGSFVCEYVGEVLTNTELYDRNIRSTGNERHTYPVLLDADWGSEGVLKDEEALCLDATYYGNVARFINHRCFDANLVEIPVEVEVPDHHYYHLAFFTTRKVEALEELTWDYGIDFNDHEHPVKAFKCLCGSKFCRGVKSPSSKYIPKLKLSKREALIGPLPFI